MCLLAFQALSGCLQQLGRFVISLDTALKLFVSKPLIKQSRWIDIEFHLSWSLSVGDTFLPVQSTNSSHAWRVTRSSSLNPLIPLGINSRICCVPLPPGSLVCVYHWSALVLVGCHWRYLVAVLEQSHIQLHIELQLISKMLLLLGTGAPIVLHRPESILSPVDTFSRVLLPPTLTILAFSRLVVTADLIGLYLIGRKSDPKHR